MPAIRSILKPGFSSLLASAIAIGIGAVGPQANAKAETLYVLNTTCSLDGGDFQPCTAEAVNVEDSTEYRHLIGEAMRTYRVLDDPHVRIEALNPETGEWSSVKNAIVRFSSNEICFNDRGLCVINPNYLNSIREDGTTRLTGRDLMALSFGSNGRVEVACFDRGCQQLLEMIGR